MAPLLWLLNDAANDVTFLQFALETVAGRASELPGDLGDQLARRLLGLGFPAPAMEILSTKNGQPASPKRQLMRAQAALATDSPRRAMIELLNLSGPEPDRLRAAALWRIGEFEQAARAALAAQEYGAASRGFWYSDTQVSVPESELALYSQLPDITQRLRRSDAGTASRPPLAQARELLKSSSDTREDVTKLLQFVRFEQPGL
jgi:hypothetical protein